jgi:hypothetical protein
MTRKSIFALTAAVVVSMAVYLLSSLFTYGLGFPLDDSWIHQTYARNLALRGEWSFLPGQPSAGSTSPLWTVLLAPGHWLGLAPLLWAYALGGLCLFLLSLLAENLVRRVCPAYRPSTPWVGLVIATEWHLVWSALSGMEILLHALLALSILGLLMTQTRRFLLTGILIGLSVWVRPDGLTLLAPAILFVAARPQKFTRRATDLLALGLGFGAFFAPYLLFNLWLSGSPWPNTFYAKQAEYADWQSQPGPVILAALLPQLLSGSLLALLPFSFISFVRSFRRSWGFAGTFLWAAGYTWLYASRLPLYQHGRYILPALPVWLVLGTVGFLELPTLLPARTLRRANFAFFTLLTLLGLSFWGLGARFYAQNVAWIETEMVVTARWIRAEIPPTAILAAHDIGAIGYFSDREYLVDLAGLISPDVIPFIQDEEHLSRYLIAEQVEYLAIFPLWYPGLIRNCQVVFETEGAFMPVENYGKMAVVRCPKP